MCEIAGMAIWNCDQRALWLVCDRFGKKIMAATPRSTPGTVRKRISVEADGMVRQLSSLRLRVSTFHCPCGQST